MRGATELLSQYAMYHRDRRNIASHFVGVPMIVFAVGVLLAKPAFMLAGVALTPAWIVFAAVAIWYLTRGNLQLGLAVTAAVGVLIALAHRVGDSGTGAWLAWGIGFFVVGWAIQFVGHWYEGRKPAFVDDLIGLLVGPMFVTAEALFSLGWGKELLAEIERRAGPTMMRDLARIA
ncbi:Mpo1-like protein [Variovorax sp. YR752]|uniref:Mpo1 family 2-hydroxy fatty acid dioxygenase n=1 Tax=Variovorax sp. YR752 TaxID=1884383 RepID=UPI0031383D78